MTVLDSPAGTSRGDESATFDFGHWRLSGRQVGCGAAMFAFAVALWSRDVRADRWLASLVVLETLLLWLPWRLPREQRSALGYWAESLTSMISPAGAIVLAIVTSAPWLSTAGVWWWYPVAFAVGIAVIAISGVRPSQIISGETAFVAGPTRRSQAAARTFNTSTAPFGEEALFRGSVLTASAGASFGLLAAVAFVARHHVQPGHNGRGSARATTVEVVAAAAFLIMTLGSRSVYPALVAHLLANVPGVVVERQRERVTVPGGKW